MLFLSSSFLLQALEGCGACVYFRETTVPNTPKSTEVVTRCKEVGVKKGVLPRLSVSCSVNLQRHRNPFTCLLQAISLYGKVRDAGIIRLEANIKLLRYLAANNITGEAVNLIRSECCRMMLR